MKILHVSPSYYPAIQFGGPIQSVHLLNKALISRGIEVDVFTTNAGLKDQAAYTTVEWKWIDGIRVKYFPFHGYEHYNFSPNLWEALRKAVKEYQLVHITAVWNFPVWAAAYACQQAGVPYIISPRGTIYPETISLKSGLFKKFYYQLIAKRILNHAAAIHYTALDEKERVEASLALVSLGVVIPNGIDLTAFADLSTPKLMGDYFPELSGKKYVLFLSRINHKKGLDILVEAFARVSLAFSDIVLVIAGPDNEGYSTQIKELLKRKSILTKTYFTGMVSGEVKIAAYRDACIFILPSYSENFGMSVVEAMACGTPVIISEQVGISSDIASQKAGLIVKTTPESIEQAICYLLKNPGERKILGVNGMKMAKIYYNIQVVVEKFVQQYQDLIQKKSDSKRKLFASN